MNTYTQTSPAAGDGLGSQQTIPLLHWSAPSKFNHERSRRWYLVAGVIVVLVAVYGIASGNWSVALVTVLLGGVTYLVRAEALPSKTISIAKEGFTFEGIFTPWALCKDFWIVETPLYAELHIVRSSGRNREVVIQTGVISVPVISSTLSEFLPMRADQRERFLDAIIRICKLS